jgi:rod shape-determining protein MreD
MSDTDFGRLFGGFLLDILPAFTIFLLIVLTTLPIGLPLYARLGGLCPLVGISYWTLIRPRDMPPLAVFFLGVLTDVFLFTPFGLHGFVFVLAQTILLRQRRFLLGQGFWVLWAAFLMLAVGAYAVTWGVMTLFLFGKTLAFHSGLYGVGLAWAVMPIILLLLNGVEGFIDIFGEPAV